MKRCCSCGELKQLEEFVKNRSKKDGIGSSCKVCKRIYDNNYYKENPKYRKDVRKHKEAKVLILKDHVYNYLLKHPCIDCGNTDVRVLEFDHVKPKLEGVAFIVSNGWSIESLKEEIDKCEVRCANCHKIRHAKEREQKRLISSNG